MSMVSRSIASRVASQFTRVGDIGSVYGGVQVKGDISVSEAIKLAGLDWRVKKLPVQVVSEMEAKPGEVFEAQVALRDKYHTIIPGFTGLYRKDIGENGEKINFPLGIIPDKQRSRLLKGFSATCRSDTGEPLGIVKTRYEPLQNHDAFSWIDNLVGKDGACVSSAGALFGGRMTWLCVDLGGFDVVPGDEVRKHLLVFNSHDGSTNLLAIMLPHRIACQNMLNFYLGKGTDTYKIRHTDGAKVKMADIDKVLAIAYSSFSKAQNAFKMMQQTRIEGDNTRNLIYDCLLGDDADKSLQDLAEDKFNKTPTWVKQAEVIEHIMETGPGANFGKNTVWGVFNGVNGYFDHVKAFRGANGIEDKHIEANPHISIESKLFGQAARMKMRAFEQCDLYTQKARS